MDSPTLPLKRTDGTTLKKNLSDNAYQNIMPTRYARKDSEGNPIEDPEDVFPRVAKNIAVAEAVEYDGEAVKVKPEHVRPDHPRRDELIDEIFGKDSSEGPVPITEKNAKWISYDQLLADDDIPEDAQGLIKGWKEAFQNQMEQLKFIPNSPTLMNAGDELQQLSACFVDSPEDDIGDIYDTAREAAEVFQSGGGMGYAFSYLRPYGDVVGSSGGIASGPITFMRSYDQMCETIAQGGTRRGAQMGIMRITHPDVIFFVHAKNKDVSLAQSLRLNDPDDPTHVNFGDALEEARGILDDHTTDDGRIDPAFRNAVEGHLSNFNISVGVTDDFMEALKAEEDFTFINPRTGEPHEATTYTKEMYDWFGLGEYVTVGEPLEIPAEELWEHIQEGAYENGEPGIVFLDRMNEDHSFPVESTPTRDGNKHEILATNPCGEQPLQEYEACNLGHINLSTIVENGVNWEQYREGYEGRADSFDLEDAIDGFLSNAIDFNELNERIRFGTRFLDNVVTMSAFPIDEIEQTVRENRKIGLGIMGLAQLYIQLGVEYGSEEGNEIARQLMRHINQRSKEVSRGLAEEKGAFNEWENSKFANPSEYPEWIERQTGLDPDEWEDGIPMRNHNTTTIAPTGTTSMIGNTTGGCEPIYNVAYYKNVSDDVQGDEMLVEFDDYFLRTLEANNIDVDAAKQEAQEQMANNEFDGIESLETVPDAIGELFVTTDDLSGKEHAAVQCACQEGVDSAISKTCNFPNSASKEDMDEVYRYIYENGGKGVTVYRDGTRTKQVLTTRADNEISESEDLSQDAAEELIQELAVKHDVDVSIGGKQLAKVNLESEEQSKFVEPRERPKVVDAEVERISTGNGTLYVTIGFDEDNDPFEVFGTIEKSGGFVQSLVESNCRMISQSLRSGVRPERVIEQLRDIQAPKVGWDEGQQVQSIPDGIAISLQRAIEDRQETEVKVKRSSAGAHEDTCPDCGAQVQISEGCKKCSAKCGWSAC